MPRLHRYTYAQYTALEKASTYITSHRERRITIHRRGSEDRWTTRVAIAGGHVTVQTLGAELNVDAIYRHSAL